MAEEMKIGDYSRVQSDALAQVEAGAHMLDVNAGIPLADEPRILAEAIQLVQSLTDVPLSIDSSIIDALESGLGVCQFARLGFPLLLFGEFSRLGLGHAFRNREVVRLGQFVKYLPLHAFAGQPGYHNGCPRVPLRETA